MQRGALELNLQSDVPHHRLWAPGEATRADVAFAPTGALEGTFMGVPRSVVRSYMKGTDNEITVRFALERDINDPQFSLNEACATRMASALADGLGASVRILAEAFRARERKGAEAVGETAKGLGRAIQALFGGPKEK